MPGSAGGGPLLVFGPRSLAYDFGPAPPADAEAVRARDRPAAGGRGGAVAGARSRRRTRSCCGSTCRPTSRRCGGSPSIPTRAGAMGIGLSDNPAFTGMHEAGATVAAGSLRAMEAILRGDVEHAHQPGGGLHHAMPDRAWGFCIYNDPALAIVRARADGAAGPVPRPRRPPRRRRPGDDLRRSGRADGLVARERPLPVPGDRVHRRGGGGGRGRDVGEHAVRAVHRARRRGSRRCGRCCRRWPRCSGRTSSCRSTAPTRTPGIRWRTCG